MTGDHDGTIEALFRDAERQLEASERDAAAVSAEKALRLAETRWGTDDIRLIPLLALLAECLRETTYGVRDEKPLPHLLRAVAIAESTLLPDDPRRGDLYRQTGLALHKAGQMEAAADIQRRAVEVYERLGRLDDVSFCIGALGSTLMQLNPAEALAACRRWVEIEVARDPNSTVHFSAVSQLGRCLILVGHGEEALRVLDVARTMLLRRSKGQPHPWMSELEERMAEARVLAARPREEGE